jgi:hypothetical protein
MLWLERKVFEDEIVNIPNIVFHTANPVGRKNMQLVLDSIERKIFVPHPTCFTNTISS